MCSKAVECQAGTKVRVISNAKPKLKSESKVTTDITAPSFPVLSYNMIISLCFTGVQWFQLREVWTFRMSMSTGGSFL